MSVVVYLCVADGQAYEGATPDLAYGKLLSDYSGGDAVPPNECVWYEAFPVDVVFAVKEKKTPKKEKTK